MGKNKLYDGFTLIELLIIILIISILVLISYSRFVGIRDKANDTNIQAAAGNFRKYMAMYLQDYNKYPVVSTSNEYQTLINELDEYGKLDKLTGFIKDDEYKVDNDSKPKSYELKLVSSHSENTYVITPSEIKTNE